MLTVLVIGFNAATRTEQMAARNFSYQESAGQMASLSVNRAIALLNTNVTNGTITQPGRSWSPSAKDVILTSASAGPSTSSTNINAFQGSNYFIATNTNPIFFTVPLVDVTVSNVLVGRYGFWIDDDSSRMNLNAALPTNRANFLPTNSRPLVFANNTISPLVDAGVRASFAALLTNANRSDVGWGYFFTPRHLARVSNVGTATYNALMYQVGAGPLNRPANSYVLAPANTPAFLDAGGANGFLSVYGSANYPRRLANLLPAIDKVSTNYFSGSNYSKYFGSAAAGGLAGKYSSSIIRQIIANINDATLPSGPSNSFTGATSLDMLLGPVSTPSTQGTTNSQVPAQVLGLRPSPFLNEVVVGVAYSTNSPPASKLEIQVWMNAELVDPYRSGLGNGWQLKYKILNLRFSGTYDDGTNRGVAFNNSASSVGWNWDGGVQSVSINRAPNPREFFVPDDAFGFEWQAGGAGATPAIPNTASNITVTSVEVQPALAILRANNDPLTVRDWAISNDFPNFVFANPTKVTAAMGYNGYGPGLAPSGVQFTNGIAKNDPRVRRFGTNVPSSPPWVPVQGSSVTLRANNSVVNFTGGTGVASLANDKVAAGGGNIFDHPSFPTNASNVSILPVWLAAFDLSKIHTGLQWRTLQLRSQDAAEAGAGLVPDWAVLEAFAVSNNPAPVSVKVNVNSIPYPAITGSSAAALLAQGLSRAPVLSSLLAGNTNNAATASVSLGGTNFSLGIPASAAFPATGAGSFQAAATNIASLAFTNSWVSRRTDSNVFPANAYGMVSEVLEINNVSNFSPDEAANEGRARGFYDALTVSSDAFTIYAVGYAMDRNTNVVAESRMRVQVARDPVAGDKFRIILAEPLVWP
jgi:hypothetical protein